MPKKIRLMDDATATTEAPAEATETNASSVDKQTVDAVMKYLEAIDWKLWEMLKIMKADQESK
jgi:hypothetical protein